MGELQWGVGELRCCQGFTVCGSCSVWENRIGWSKISIMEKLVFKNDIHFLVKSFKNLFPARHFSNLYLNHKSYHI